MVHAVPSRSDALRAHRAAGGGLAAVLPIHYPRALLRAHGLLPVEVWGPPGRSTASGDAHLQGYTCSIVRCALSFALDGGLKDAQVVMVPHGCDSLQALGSLLLDLVPPGMPVLPLYLPRGRRPADEEFLAAELRAVGSRLAEITGRRPTDGELLARAAAEEAADEALAALWEARPRLPHTNREFYRLLRAREYLPAERFTPLARAALDQPGPAAEGLPVLLSGIVPEPASLLDALDRLGVLVVADDLACSGRRVYPPAVHSDPYRRLAQSLMGGPPDPMRGDPFAARNAHLKRLAEEAGALGALFWEVKFCEPEQFYLPSAQQALQGRGVRCLTVEVDLADPLPAAAVNRIEAFAETLS